MPDIDSLAISIESQATSATQGIDTLITKLQGLKNALNVNTSAKSVERLKSALGSISELTKNVSGLANLGQAIRNFSDTTRGTRIPASIARELLNIGAAAELLQGVDVSGITNLANALKEFQGLDGIRITLPQVGGETSGAEAPAQMAEGNDVLTSSFHDEEEAAHEAENSTSTFIERLKAAIGVVRSFGQSLSSNIGTGLGRVSSVVNGFSSAIGRVRQSVPIMDGWLSGGFLGRIKESVKGFGQFFSSIKRIAMYRLIRTALKEITKYIGEGVKNLYNWSKANDKAFSNSMDKIATASKYMGNSFAAMISPIVNALAPVIDFIADKIVDLFNLINQVFARLSGASTYTAAKKVATVWDDSSKKTKKAVDDMKRTILAFDEINKLNAPKDGSGSGSSTADNAANMFETRTIEGGVASFTDALREAFTSGDWETLGSMLGGKVDEMIRKIDFAGIGSKVGYYINGLFSTKYWTLDAINFTNIGASIATFLNNAIANIDFGMIARSWVQDLTIIADTLIGFFTNFDFGQLAGKLSDFAVNFFDEVTRWLNTVDWYELGQTLWTKITDFFANIDYEQLFTSIFTNIGTSIEASNDFLMGILDSIFSWIGQGISDWWDNNIVGQDSGTILTNVLQALFGVNTAISIGKWVTKNIINPLISSLLGIDKEKFDEVTDNLFDGIKESWDRLISLPGKVLNFVVDAFKNPEEWWANVKKWWHETTVGKAVDSFITNPRNTALSWWNSVQAWWHDTTFGKFVDGFLTNVVDSSAQWWADVQKWWHNTTLGKSVDSFTVKVKNTALVWWNNVKTWWKAKIGPVEEFVVNVKNTAAAWWNSVQAWWHSTTVGKKVDSFLTNVSNTASTWWSDVVSWWKGVVNSSPIAKIKIDVLDTVSEWWDQIVEWWNKFVSGKFLGINIGFGDGNSGSDNPGIDSDYNEMLIRREIDDLQWRLTQDGLRTTVDVDMWTPWWSAGKSVLQYAGLTNLRTTVTLDFVRGTVSAALNGLLNGFGGRRAKGGIYANGSWSDIPQYAGGTTNAHGSLFLAGEAGPEIVGHVGGRTEVLNKSQLAAAMYSAVQAAMAPVAAGFSAVTQGMGSEAGVDIETFVAMVRQAVEQAMSRSNDYDRQKVELLRSINEKDLSVDVSTSSINRAQQRMNRRAGTTIAPVGTT